jgi:phage gpG-like protein
MAVAYKYKLDTTVSTEAMLGIKERAGDMRPPLRTIARHNVDQTRRRFLAGRGPDGQVWKKGLKTSGKTLIGAGILMRSIQDRPPTGNSVEWGSNLIYARVHQFGATVRPVTAGGALRFQLNGRWVIASKVEIPARPYLGMNQADLENAAGTLLAYVAGPLGGPLQTGPR